MVTAWTLRLTLPPLSRARRCYLGHRALCEAMERYTARAAREVRFETAWRSVRLDESIKAKGEERTVRGEDNHVGGDAPWRLRVEAVLARRSTSLLYTCSVNG